MSCQWGGYRASKARPGYRCRSEQAGLAGAVQGPMLRAIVTLKEAKAAASAMAKGSAGNYQISHPIAHLNGIAARMLDAETA
jgi:hypothetical protein